MPAPTEYSFIRYLSAKRSVDDRALNQRVWDHLAAALHSLPNAGPLTVLEIGAGIGTMLERMLENRLLPASRYVLVDAEADNVQTATLRLADWAVRYFGSTRAAQGDAPFPLRPLAAFHIDAPAVPPLDVYTYHNDLFDFLDAVGPVPTVDLLVANAFMDLVDVPATLARLTSVLRPNALVYLTINFDGATILQPAIDPALDAQIERLYHATMDQRIVNGKPSGDSHTGRHLFDHLVRAGIRVLDAGSSDWVVFPHEDGYHDDEAYFLHFIIHTIQNALHGAPGLDAARLADWAAARHAQIERGELLYIAHQLDYLGRYTEGSE